jgi:hypothetical protein
MIYSIISISAGASVGALIRWYLAGRFNPFHPYLPPGTLAANLIGGYLIGVAIAVFASLPELSPQWLPWRAHDLLHLLRRSGHPAAAGPARLGAGNGVPAPGGLAGAHGPGDRHRGLAAPIGNRPSTAQPLA